MNIFQKLVSGDETEIDSVVVTGLVGLVVLFGVTIYFVVAEPSLFSYTGFGTSTATIIGAAGATKTARDRLSTPPQTLALIQPSPPSGVR